MQQETFTVQNVKCGGCATAIRNGLSELPGVSEVQVEIESGRVTVAGDGFDRGAIAAKLAELGYPEKSAG